MYHNILVPLDGSELAECVLPHVESIARGCSVPNVTFITIVEPVHIMGGFDYSIPMDEQQKWLQQRKTEAESYLKSVVSRLNHNGVNFQTAVLEGHTVNALIEYVNQKAVDLIIIATHGRSGISRWVWGSTTDRILRGVCAPVLIIRAPGCVTGA